MTIDTPPLPSRLFTPSLEDARLALRGDRRDPVRISASLGVEPRHAYPLARTHCLALPRTGGLLPIFRSGQDRASGDRILMNATPVDALAGTALTTALPVTAPLPTVLRSALESELAQG